MVTYEILPASVVKETRLVHRQQWIPVSMVTDDVAMTTRVDVTQRVLQVLA